MLAQPEYLLIEETDPQNLEGEQSLPLRAPALV